MKILFVTNEFAGLAKSGGLADVSAALPRALRAREVDIRVLLPGYPAILQEAAGITIVASLPARGEIESCLIGEMTMPDGLPLYVVLAPSLYQRPGTPYAGPDGIDFSDNDLRFARLALAAMELARGRISMDWKPDLVHCHDWPAALAPAYMVWAGVDVPSLMTVHNLSYQGVFPAARLDALGIPAQAFDINGLEFHGQISFLKAGLYYAHHVTTVSPTYAREITQEPHGAGFQGLLAGLAGGGRLTGILNGIDEGWDPADDPHLYTPFDHQDASPKKEMRRRIRTGLCLQKSQGPLFSIVSRLVHQKGLDLVAAIAPRIVERGGQIAVLGVGEPQIEQMLAEVARHHRGHVALLNGFNEAMAHRIMAASDFYLMPSRFEPCGLSQMHALRYGALPIAHATGGLMDTIRDGESGFLFDTFSSQSFMAAVERAFVIYHHPPTLTRMRQAAMQERFDWSEPAERYTQLYAKITGLAAPGFFPSHAKISLPQPSHVSAVDGAAGSRVNAARTVIRSFRPSRTRFA